MADPLASGPVVRPRAVFPAQCDGCGNRTRTMYEIHGYTGTRLECNTCFKGRPDPDLLPLACPHCNGGSVTVEAGGMLWAHSCGAYGYYDDGTRTFPDAVYRVRGVGLHRHGAPTPEGGTA